MTKKKAPSSTERMQRLRKRYRKRGLVLLQVWIYPEHRELIKRYVEKTIEQRKEQA